MVEFNILVNVIICKRCVNLQSEKWNRLLIENNDFMGIEDSGLP